MKKTSAILLIFLVLIVSISIMIVPTFFTKGISRITLHQELDLPLILNDNKDIEIIFFGYAGCVDICTPRLQALSDFYNKLNKKIKQRVGLVFLDISSPINKNLPSEFAKSFNDNFRGIYLNSSILRNYTKAFSVYFSKSLMNKTEYDHTTNLYIVKRDKRKKEVRYIYTAYPYDFKQINLDIKALLNE
ncbi:MAG: SCO family protein [Sulfurimonas sp.]